MGAEVFYTKVKGDSAESAFKKAKEDAFYMYGHRGYTGSIAEKSNFVVIPLPEGIDPGTYVDQLIDECDARIDSKWGPAGCLSLGDGEYVFFGWASS